jgi:phosphate starvation-inducible protein PhoH and related proteins
MSTSKKSRNKELGSEKITRPSQIKINGFEPICARNYAQGAYLEALRSNQIVFAVGPAGTGKSYIATAYAAEQLYYKKVDKIIITRPAVEAEESLGFLPGELDEKYAPYLTPVRDILEKLLGKPFIEYCLRTGSIEPVPIAYMRGRTFENSICIIDEAQNVTPGQMKLILSRIGENCRFIIDGDTTQKDIKGNSGLEDAITRLEGLKGVEVVRFLNEDIVRSDMCKRIIKAYSV